MKQTAASAAIRNVSRSVRSMAGAGLTTELDAACRSFLPKLPSDGFEYCGKFSWEESEAG